MPRGPQGLHHELPGADRDRIGPGVAGVELAEREQIIQRASEPIELARHQLDRLTGPRGQVRRVLEQAQAGGQGGHRRTQLVGHVGGEARCSMRCRSASTMWLKDPTSAARSGEPERILTWFADHLG